MQILNGLIFTTINLFIIFHFPSHCSHRVTWIPSASMFEYWGMQLSKKVSPLVLLLNCITPFLLQCSIACKVKVFMFIKWGEKQNRIHIWWAHGIGIKSRKWANLNSTTKICLPLLSAKGWICLREWRKLWSVGIFLFFCSVCWECRGNVSFFPFSYKLSVNVECQRIQLAASSMCNLFLIMGLCR